jgi:Rod binding domain-containing protein
MDVSRTNAGGSTATGANPRDTPERIQKAAKDFEAVLIGQMLKSVRESSFGGGWGTSDQSGDVALDMAEQQMAQLMASNGGLGLAHLISKGLENTVSQSNAGHPSATPPVRSVPSNSNRVKTTPARTNPTKPAPSGSTS